MNMMKTIKHPESKDEGILKLIKDGYFDKLLEDYDKCKEFIIFAVENNKYYLDDILKRIKSLLMYNDYGTMKKLFYSKYGDSSNLLLYQLRKNKKLINYLICDNINNRYEGKILLMHVMENKLDITYDELCDFVSDVNINFKDNDLKTPLMYAIKYNYTNFISYLIEKGADIYAKDRDNKTALSYLRKLLKSLKNNNEYKKRIMCMLISKNVCDDKTIKDIFRNRYGYQILDIYIDHELNTNNTNNSKQRTSLMYACMYKQYYIKKILKNLVNIHKVNLEYVNRKDIDGDSALDILIKNNKNEKYINILIDYGAEIPDNDNDKYVKLRQKYKSQDIDLSYDSEYELDIIFEN